MKTATDPITHNGKTYSLADLVHYMEWEESEALHSSFYPPDDKKEDAHQAYWNEFARRFPESADHLVEIVPEIER